MRLWTVLWVLAGTGQQPPKPSGPLWLIDACNAKKSYHGYKLNRLRLYTGWRLMVMLWYVTIKVATVMDNTKSKLALGVGEWRKSTYQIWLHYRVIIFEIKKNWVFVVTYHRRRRLAETIRVAAAASAPNAAPAAMAAVLPGTRHRQSS